MSDVGVSFLCPTGDILCHVGDMSPTFFSHVADTRMFVYFTNLHLVNFLTINQQFGHEAEGNRSGQRQVMFVNGQAF
jgi:hypothetical protein